MLSSSSAFRHPRSGSGSGRQPNSELCSRLIEPARARVLRPMYSLTVLRSCYYRRWSDVSLRWLLCWTWLRDFFLATRPDLVLCRRAGEGTFRTPPDCSSIDRSSGSSEFLLSTWDLDLFSRVGVLRFCSLVRIYWLCVSHVRGRFERKKYICDVSPAFSALT